MIRCIVLTLIACLFSMPSVATCEEFPETFLGFIEEGSHVGVTFDQNGMSRHMKILAESDVQLEKDVRELDQPALLAKYPALAEKADAALKRFSDGLKKKSPPVPGMHHGEPTVKVSPGAGLLHRIVHVGKDYLVLESLAPEPIRFVVNAEVIKQISWYHGPGVATEVNYIRDKQLGSTVPPQQIGDE